MESKETSQTKPDYSNKEFWNQRFGAEEKYDWYITWKEFKPYLKAINLPPTGAILNVGSGNSPLPFDMWRDGLTNLTNIDISDKAIEVMKTQAESQGIGGTWQEMDATKMAFQSDTFDVVIDKGTLDALVCADDKTIPANLIKEMFRVVKPNGHVFLITHSSPELRREFLAECLPPHYCQLEYCQQSLCAEVNMVNILRTIGNGKPLREVVKDPELFKQFLVEMQRDSAASSYLSGDWRTYSWTFPGKIESGVLEMKAKNLELAEKLKEEKAQVQDENKSAEERTQRVPRQNYCFIYRIRKIPL